VFFRQLIDADLGCASYVIADAGGAIVVDPSGSSHLAASRLL
jgi:hypothetical protein